MVVKISNNFDEELAFHGYKLILLVLWMIVYPGYMKVSGATSEDIGLPLHQRTIEDKFKQQDYTTAIFSM
ncbi:hypothetical protein VBZ51_16805 [Maribacter sp. HS]|uniref:hypothetical protein n=1 Tax=Maribacter sp. HS TaxID=3110480 RepID=UPI003A87A8F6